jgi:hypothetical protein
MTGGRMKKVLLSVFVLLSFAYSSFAMDEDTYVRFVADSIVIAHNFKGRADAARLWAEEIRKMYPAVPAQDIRSFEETLAGDSALKGKVYNRILENIRARGYKAHISNPGTGLTSVEIEG